jgi:hypothetical protein
VVLGLALAVGAPVGWELTRPPAAAGVPVAEALAAPVAPQPTPQPTPEPGPVPAIATRDAAPSAVAAVPGPVRLTVRALGVDAAVDPIGVAPDGQLDLPEDVDRVGWYRFGPVPGGAGSAVLAGHVDDQAQGLGALGPLREAAPGDDVQVTDATGATTRWRVVGRELVDKPDLPLGALFGRAGPPRLVLITCGGPFRPELRSYRDNVVVVAEPAG